MIGAFRPTLPAVLALAGLLSGTAGMSAHGADSVADPEARRLLDEVVATYRALPAYADQGTFRLLIDLGGTELTRATEMALTYARPNRIALATPAVRLVGDGTGLTTVIEPLKSYSVEPAPAEIHPETFDNMTVGALLFGDPSGTPTTLVLGLLAGDDPALRLLGPTGRLALEADAEVDGKALRSVRLDRPDGPDVRLLIDPETKLIGRIELLVDPADRGGSPVVSAAWSSGKISTEMPPDGVFTLEPPDGFARVADLASRRGPDQAGRTPLDDLVGRPAPEFNLTVLDGPGTTRELAGADLRGKVILLDFWATWCGPCLAELPDIQKLVDDYETRAPGALTVVALSQDEEPADLDGIRRKVDQTLADAGLTLAEGPVGLVALDPRRAIGQAFHVSALPTLVLIDAEGVVRAVHVGNEPGVRDRLAGQIEALREGRPLKGP